VTLDSRAERGDRRGSAQCKQPQLRKSDPYDSLKRVSKKRCAFNETWGRNADLHVFTLTRLNCSRDRAPYIFCQPLPRARQPAARPPVCRRSSTSRRDATNITLTTVGFSRRVTAPWKRSFERREGEGRGWGVGGGCGIILIRRAAS